MSSLDRPAPSALRRHLSRLGLAALLGLAPLAPAPAMAQEADAPAEVKKATHGDWDIICLEGRDVCAMQQVGRDDQGNAILAVEVQKVEGLNDRQGRSIPALMTVTTTIGVLLRPGIVVKVDGGESRKISFEVCLPDRCIATRGLLDTLLNEYKRGNTAAMAFGATQQGEAREVRVDISLRGFTRAFNEL